MSDQFFREVDEAVRQDRYKELWDRYGLHALVAAALIVAGVAGFKGWTYWQDRKAQEAGTEFSRALGALESGDAAKANTALQDLAQKGPAGYRMLARFQLAAAEAQGGNTDKTCQKSRILHVSSLRCRLGCRLAEPTKKWAICQR